MRRRRLWLAGMALVSLLVPWLGAVVYPWPYQPLFLAASRKYGVSAYLLAGVARTESRFDPSAQSSRGALGLMQVLPATAAYLTHRPVKDVTPALRNPQFSIDVGAQYLSSLSAEFRDVTAAVAAYNGGDATVRGWIADGIWRPNMPPSRIPYPETAEFVERVRHFTRWYAYLYPGRLPMRAK